MNAYQSTDDDKTPVPLAVLLRAWGENKVGVQHHHEPLTFGRKKPYFGIVFLRGATWQIDVFDVD
ncbi:hypothetical protein [Rodentibacter rarus]|uniref:hypothetical protein n=1 Tax=Rodentibacter rarus TaxID=1908260 RepID=UPI0015C2DB53|nr:hypothetical protein [Rodentibacter rarus]